MLVYQRVIINQQRCWGLRDVNCWNRDGKHYETAPVPFRHVLLKRHAPCKTSQAGTSGTVWKFAVWSVKRQRQLVFVLRYFFWIWIWFTFVPFGSFRNTSQIVCGPVAHAYPPSICSRAEYRHRTSNHSGHSAARPLGKANGPRLFSTFGYGSKPIHTIFRGMNIHLPAILMWTTGG